MTDIPPWREELRQATAMRGVASPVRPSFWRTAWCVLYLGGLWGVCSGPRIESVSIRIKSRQPKSATDLMNRLMGEARA
jgi:hypothetical protein